MSVYLKLVWGRGGKVYRIHTVHSPTDAHLLKLGLKFTLKLFGSYTCFGLRPSSGSLQLSLAKVILI